MKNYFFAPCSHDDQSHFTAQRADVQPCMYLSPKASSESRCATLHVPESKSIKPAIHLLENLAETYRLERRESVLLHRLIQ